MSASRLINAFHSEHLIYRAIEDTDEDRNWYHEHIRNDPTIFGLGDSNLVRPQTKAKSNSHLNGLATSLLGVFICLKPCNLPPPATTTDDSTVHEPTRIGVLVLDDEASDNYRHHHRLACLTLSISNEFQDRGYGSEAINWAIDWAFSRANMHSVSLGCTEYNERGRHLYEKLGFVMEGKFRKCHFHERKWWDLLLFSLLEDEWVKLRGGEIEGKGQG